MKKPSLYIVIPCYNEEKVLPITSELFLKKLKSLIKKEKISKDSKIMFVNDGSKDSTWEIIKDLSKKDEHYIGVSLSRNRGHQNALLGGLMTAKEKCDITISIDCDGQDDINAMDEMVDAYLAGSDIVYGVRSSRKKDTFFKRNTAQLYYKFLKSLGVDTVYNHADYRLLSKKVLEELSNFKEVNLFLRGMIPLVGFKSSIVTYEREERIAGESHYPLKKMLALAINGITSLSIKPISLITFIGCIVFGLSFISLILSIIFIVKSFSFASIMLIISCISLFSGLQLIAIGVIGEYIGKIYLETKGRPRFIIGETTYEK